MKTLAALVIVTVVGVNSYPFLDHEYTRTPLGDSIDKATLKMLKEAYQIGSDKNVITSPLGVMILLSLYSAGGGPQVQEQIRNYLGEATAKQATESYSALSQDFAKMNPDYLTLANKIYVANRYTLDDQFSKVAGTYKSEVENLDFTKPQEAADVINHWADEKTKGHIKKPVSPDILTPDVAVALFNVIFFQGHWNVPFEAEKTKDLPFHVDRNTTVNKPTMHLTQSLFYTENKNIGARMIELPYKETGFRMVVVLPDEIDGLPDVLNKVAEHGLLEDVFNLSPAGRDVDLYMPKFEIKSKLDLNEILPKVGVSKLFEEAATGIVKNNAVVVSKAFQEAFVKVDEEGATAGAFTGFLVVATSSISEPPPPLEFRVDHPFLFLIMYEDKVLFAGTHCE